jgi:hypothetical protein
VADGGHGFFEKLQAFSTQLLAERRYSGEISAGARQTGDQTGCDRVAGRYHHNGNCVGRAHSGHGTYSSPGEDNVDFHADKFPRKVGQPVGLSIGEAIFERDVFVFHPAMLS